jgi:hypothetical protein
VGWLWWWVVEAARRGGWAAARYLMAREEGVVGRVESGRVC